MYIMLLKCHPKAHLKVEIAFSSFNSLCERETMALCFAFEKPRLTRSPRFCSECVKALVFLPALASVP